MLEDLVEYPAAQCANVEIAQYELVAQRRDTTNALLWQSPGLSLTAQAFLFVIALGTGAASSRAIAAALALIVALASAQLLMKHRAFETADAEWLSQFEQRHRYQAFWNINAKRRLVPKSAKHWWGKACRRAGFLIVVQPASIIWFVLLLLFGAAAALVLLNVLF